MQNLRSFRIGLGKTQTQFWSELGVDQGMGSKYELGHHSLPKPVVILLKLIYNYEVNEE